MRLKAWNILWNVGVAYSMSSTEPSSAQKLIILHVFPHFSGDSKANLWPLYSHNFH